MTFLLGMSQMNFGQTNINGQVDLLDLGISVNLTKDWEVVSKTKKTILNLKESGNKTKIEITSMKFSEALDNILNSEHKKKVNEVISSLKSSELDSNLTVKMDFSKTEKEIKNEYEFLTIYKAINEQAFLIKAKVDITCIECKKDIELIIESMQSLK